jgi:hypothetical protein
MFDLRDRRGGGRAGRRRDLRRRPGGDPPPRAPRPATASSRSPPQRGRRRRGPGPDRLVVGLRRHLGADRRRRQARRRGGHRHREGVRPGPRPPLELADVEAAQDTYETPTPRTRSRCRSTRRSGGRRRDPHDAEVDGVMVATAQLLFWDTDKWFVSSQGHRIHQHLVESGCGMDATAVGEHETQRRSYPQSFGHVETGGYEVIRRFDLPGHAQADRRGGRPAAVRGRLPRRRAGPDPRVLPARAADPRVGRPRHRARPHPRLGGGLRRHLVPRARPARHAALRLGADEHHRRRDHPRRARDLRLRRRGHPRPVRRHRPEGIWVGVLSGRDSAHLAGLRARAGWSAPTGSTACRWCA